MGFDAHGWPVADDCIFVDPGHDDAVFKTLGAAIDEGRVVHVLAADLVGPADEGRRRVEGLATRMARYGAVVWVVSGERLKVVPPKLTPSVVAAYERRRRGREDGK